VGKKIGETVYSINWLPIGGFVKLYGEDEAGSGKISVAKEKKKSIRIKMSTVHFTHALSDSVPQ